VRNSRRRDLKDKRMRRVVMDVEESAFNAFSAWTGPFSYGYTFEKMIEAEKNRRKRRAEKANALSKPN
jgi:hypothetical protein